MKLTKEEQESIFFDTLIHMFRTNPQLYDKCEATYVYTPQKIELLKQLSDYLKNEFDIVKGVQDIVAAWQKLVSQFKKADEKQATGSAASENNFQYYEDLLFLKPAIKHKTNINSTMTSRTSALINKPSAEAQPNSVQQNTWTTANWPTASATSEYFGLHPYSMPFAVPSAGQHMQWLPIPYGFNSPMPINYSPFPFPSVAPSTDSLVPTQNTPAMISTPALALSHTPVATETSALKKDSSVPTTSTNKRIVPEYDNFAKKKLKLLNEDEQQFKKISNHIIDTLDKVNKKFTASESSKKISTNVSSRRNLSHSTFNQSPQTSQSVISNEQNYSNLLSAALAKVPTKRQDELMAYILEELSEFNNLYKST